MVSLRSPTSSKPPPLAPSRTTIFQAAIGAEDIARGDLATSMGLPPQTVFQVQDIHELPTPSAMADSVDQEIDRAFVQRHGVDAAGRTHPRRQGSLKQARSAYIPTIGFSGDGGLARAYGQQDLDPGSYARAKSGTSECR